MPIDNLPVTMMAFLAAFLAVFWINVFLSDKSRKRRSVRQRARDLELRQREREETLAQLKSQPRLLSNQDEHLSVLAEEALQETAVANSLPRRIQAMIEQSGLPLTVGKLVSYSVACALIVGGIGVLVSSGGWWGLIVAPIGAVVPFVYVHIVRQRRMDALRAQLPDSFDLMSRILRAGQTIPQAMHAVSQEFRAPVATEFGYCYEQQNLGLSPDLALRDLARRTGLLEIKVFVIALMVHRTVGGNLANLLDKLAELVRARFVLNGKIKSLTAEGRLQAVFLLILPVVLWGGLFLINADYALDLFRHPILPIVTVISMGIGSIWIWRIVNFDW